MKKELLVSRVDGTGAEDLQLIWYGGIGHYCDRVPSRDGKHTVLVSRVDGTVFMDIKQFPVSPSFFNSVR